MRPEIYLFPATVNHSRADKPISEKIVWQAVREARKRAGIKKGLTAQAPKGALLRQGVGARTRKEMPATAARCGLA